jgi:hypothetical protein
MTDSVLEAALAGRAHTVAYDRAGLGDSDPDRQIPFTERTVATLAAPVTPGLPTVVISATEGRPVRIRRLWTALQAELAAERGARHVVAYGSGHAVPLYRPGLVAEAILGCVQ